MRIISWNSNMAFRKKWNQIIKFKPDILVIQECEIESKYTKNQLIPNYNQFIWIGENQNKGIGIISFNDYNIKISKSYNKSFKYFIPIEVTGNHTFNLYAIWAMPNKNSTLNSYVGQIWNAINFYDKVFKKDSILVGDWNSNTIWDKKRKTGNHSQVVNFLDRYNINSIYHELNHEIHGKESKPTLFLLKKKNKPFHIDYCFATKTLITQNTKIEIGNFEDWITFSDHMPVFIHNLME